MKVPKSSTKKSLPKKTGCCPLTIGRVASSQLLLMLHATILEPRLDLRLAQTQRRRQLDALRRRQISLRLETLLQTRQLRVTEHGARLAPPAMPQCIHAHAQAEGQFRHTAGRPEEGRSSKKAGCKSELHINCITRTEFCAP